MREAMLTLPAFTVLYVAAGLLGRATSVDHPSMSLVWPATGIAVLWFLSLARKSAVAVSAVLVVTATIVISLATRSSSDLGVVAAAAHLTQIAVVVVLVRRWCPELGLRGGQPPLETPGALMRFMGATAIGCAAGVAVGVVGLLVVDASFAPVSAVAWWGRNVLGVLALGTSGLLLIHRLAGRGRSTRSRVSRARALETMALGAATVGIVGLDYLSGLSFAFLLPAATVWAALRFSPLVVSSQAILGGVAVIWLTLNDHGLFVGSGSESTQVVLAQLFVGMTIMIGLFLAAGRQESARLQAELNRRQRDMATFARRAAHDLQNPLMLIEGWAGLLEAQAATPVDDDQPATADLEMVRRIQSATEQMRVLVSDLLIDATARDHPLVREYVDLAALVDAVVEARGVQDLVRVGEFPPVAGDAPMLRRLVDNLIGNALKYVVPGERPDIEIAAHVQRGGALSVWVADRGIGIPDGCHDAVFGEFNRAHGDAYPGTGLGLSICRRIVERHGGEITARARHPGPGTIVEFRLPLWKPPTPTIHRREGSSALVSSERA
jgi:signal transduction histidine kinase